MGEILSTTMVLFGLAFFLVFNGMMTKFMNRKDKD